MVYTKLPISIAEQIKLLKSRGLRFIDETILCCVAYLLHKISPGNTFAYELATLIDSYPIVNVSAMGFPQDWRNEPLWSI